MQLGEHEAARAVVRARARARVRVRVRARARARARVRVRARARARVRARVRVGGHDVGVRHGGRQRERGGLDTQLERLADPLDAEGGGALDAAVRVVLEELPQVLPAGPSGLSQLRSHNPECIF